MINRVMVPYRMYIKVAFVVFLSWIQAVYLLQHGLLGHVKMWKRREQRRIIGALGYVEDA